MEEFYDRVDFYKSSVIGEIQTRNVSQFALSLSCDLPLFWCIISQKFLRISPRSHILPKSRFFVLHFYPRQYGTKFNQCDTTGPKVTVFGEKRSGKLAVNYAAQGH